MEKDMLICIFGESCVGKTTLANALKIQKVKDYINNTYKNGEVVTVF